MTYSLGKPNELAAANCANGSDRAPHPAPPRKQTTHQQGNNLTSKNTNHRANTNQNLRREHNSLHRPSYRSPSFSALDLRHGFAQAG
jgi:hypothetical protein